MPRLSTRCVVFSFSELIYYLRSAIKNCSVVSVDLSTKTRSARNPTRVPQSGVTHMEATNGVELGLIHEILA